MLGKSDFHVSLTFFAITFGGIVLYLFSFDNIFAHNFSPDDSANFLTAIDKIRTESKLVEDDVGNKNGQNLAKYHADNAVLYFDPVTKKEVAEKNAQIANELVDELNNLQMKVKSQKSKSSVIENVENIEDLLDEAISARINEEQMNNSTIQALAFANIISIAIEKYGDAFNIEIDLTNTTNLNDNKIMADMYNRPSGYKEQNNKVINQDKYESALAFFDVGLKRFFKEITSSLQSEENYAEKQSYLKKLENGLLDLKESMEKKANAMKVIEIIYTDIHPNLQILFNLKLK